MPRIFLPSIPAKEHTGSVRITGENARYIISVLRLGTGDDLTLLDPEGNQYRAEIKQTGRNNLLVELKETLSPQKEPATGIILLQGILKGRKMDLIVQKATELGVKEIIPLITERAQIRETRKQERWRKIALEASRQSGRAVVPEVKRPVKIDEFFNSFKGPVRGFIFWEQGGMSLNEAFTPAKERLVYVAVGPEGGFTGEEVRLAEQGGLVRTTLGNRILRAETAAVSAVTLVQFLVGEMG